VIAPGNSRAAAVLADLLREIEGLPVEQALIAESLAYGALQGSAEHAAWLEQRAAVPILPSGQVLVQRDVGTLAITLDRPHAHNAIDRAMRDDLRAAFDIAALDPEVDRVLLTATGKAFCIGADLSEFGTTRDPATAHAIRMATLPAHAIAACAERLEVRIQGACIGAGLEMAAFARHIVAALEAWFQLPELAMGLIPGAGGCVSVSRRIGNARTLELVLSGKRISARTALEWGLIDAIEG
jgi:enoyl-CoA hydratase/carnithine racemase